MDIEKEIIRVNSSYQIAVARAILSFLRLDANTQKQLKLSYEAIIEDYEDRIGQEISEDERRDIDEFLDNPRHGQAESINRGDF